MVLGITIILTAHIAMCYNKKVTDKHQIKVNWRILQMTDSKREYLTRLLELAQSGDNIATDNLITHIRDNEMKRRIGKYLRKNRQVEDEDLKQEFMIGVALAIPKASMDIGDPIEYIISQGVYRVRSYLRKHIIQNTTQICNDCGYESRLNRINNKYICKKCGSDNIETRELCDHDEIVMMSICDDSDDIEKMVEDIGAIHIIEKFRDTLDKNTKVYNLFTLLYDKDINSSNPDVINYIAEIAGMWHTSQTLVVQTREKLRVKILRFCEQEGLSIKDNKFIQIK